MNANAKETGRVPPIAAESTPAMASPYDRLVAHWPGPAARLAQNGAVLGANAAAKAMLAEFSARTGDLSALAAEISGGGASRLDTVVVPGAAAPVTLDVSLVPAGDTVLILARDVSLAANMRNALADSRKR
ncbi:MAG: hypothetical protein JNJ97_14345, partial [Alphaproteobacteria bacterium]|nr:hypothetical protein [Alphaproteobacteria bacterium]